MLLLLTNFEDNRRNGNDGIREHLFHMIKVYVIGIILLENMKDSSTTDDLYERWAEVALFHDFGYPVEKFEHWYYSFLKDIVPDMEKGKLTEIKSFRLLQSSHIARMIHKSINWLCNNIYKVEYKKELDAEDKKELRSILEQMVFENLFNKRDHAVISAIFWFVFLNKDVEKEEDIWMFSAILFHNLLTWTIKYYRKRGETPISGIKIKANNSTLLLRTLLLADNIQDFGRIENKFSDDSEDRDTFYENVSCEDKILSLIFENSEEYRNGNPNRLFDKSWKEGYGTLEGSEKEVFNKYLKIWSLWEISALAELNEFKDWKVLIPNYKNDNNNYIPINIKDFNQIPNERNSNNKFILPDKLREIFFLRNPPLIAGLDYSEDEIKFSLRQNKLLMLTIFTTKKCNLKCPYCFTHSWKENNLLSLNEYKDIIAQSKQLGAKSVWWVGTGEPFLYEHWKELIEFITELDLWVGIYTNGTSITKEIASFLKEQNVSLYVKMNSFKKEVQNKLVGNIGDAFNLIKNSINNLLDVKFNDINRFAIETVITKLNYDEIPKIFRWCREKNIIPFIEIMEHVNEDARDLDVTLEEHRDLFNRLLEIDETEFGYSWIPYPPWVAYRCRNFYFSMAVDSSGNVQPCSGFHGISIGNVREKSLKELWDDPLMKRFRDPSRIEPNYDSNGSLGNYGCKSHAYHITKKLFSVDPRIKVFNKLK